MALVYPKKNRKQMKKETRQKITIVLLIGIILLELIDIIFF